MGILDMEIGDKVRIASDASLGPQTTHFRGKFGEVKAFGPTGYVHVVVSGKDVATVAVSQVALVPSDYCPECDRRLYRHEMADYLCRDCRFGL